VALANANRTPKAITSRVEASDDDVPPGIGIGERPLSDAAVTGYS
jgi:hypothetical protein